MTIVRSETDLISLLILFFFLFFFFLYSCWGDPRLSSINPRLRRFKSDLDEIWQECSRLTESAYQFDVTLSRWWPWRYFTQKVLSPGE